MANKALVVGSVLGVLIAPAVYKNYSSQNIPTNSGPVRAASAAEPPNCPHGLEPGGGPMRCADPNDPNSYLFKKANQQAQQPTKSQTKNTGVYSIENPPKTTTPGAEPMRKTQHNSTAAGADSITSPCRRTFALIPSRNPAASPVMA